MDATVEKIERYRILEEVGRGGMAVVYRARDETLGREVALKVLHAHLSSDPESRARFQREAKAVARLHHPHIIEIFDFAENDEGPSYLVTEFIPGQTLRSFFQDNQVFQPEIAALVGIPICAAVAHAHSQQIIHRDLKPENIMIDTQGIPKLMDFGIAKVLDTQQQLTLTGSLLGSPAHMAPELIEGRELDTRSDVFSIGTILYWLATGRLPFQGNNPHQILKLILEGRFEEPTSATPTVGSEFSRIIRKAMALKPEERFPSAAALQSALAEFLSELGLGEPGHELSLFFSDPQKYLATLMPQVNQKLLTRARRLLHGHQYRNAMEVLDRLLAMDPHQPEVLKLVNGVARSEGWARWLRWGSRVGVGIAVLALGWWGWATRSPEIVPPPNSSEPSALARAPEPETVEPFVPPLATTPDRPLAKNLPSPTKLTPSKPTPLTLTAPRPKPVAILTEPYFDRILIDNREVARADLSTSYGQRFQTQLPPGNHPVRIERSGCQDDEFNLAVSQNQSDTNPTEIRRILRFRPAQLVIRSELSGTRVFIDGLFKGSADDTRTSPLTLTLEGRQGRRTVALLLTHPEAGELRRTLTIEAGVQKEISFRREDFAPTPPPTGGAQ